MFLPPNVSIPEHHIEMEGFFRVNRLEKTLTRVLTPGSRCDMLLAGVPLFRHHAYFVTGYEYMDKFYYEDAFLDEFDAHRALFELNRVYNVNRLEHVDFVVEDVVGVTRIPKNPGSRPVFFIKQLTML